MGGNIQGFEEIQAKKEGTFQQISVLSWLRFDLKFSWNKNRLPLIIFETRTEPKMTPKRSEEKPLTQVFAAAPWEA